MRIAVESLWRRLVHGTQRLWQRCDWPAFVGGDWPAYIMQASLTDRLHAKQGRTTGRWIIARDGRRLAVYVKRHYRLSWWRGLMALIWPERGWSPAWEEWRHLDWARRHGVPVPAAVVAGEFIGPWGRLQSVLAVEELDDMLPLHEAVPRAHGRLEPRVFQQWKRGLAAELARLTRHLHRHRRFHKDLYFCHFYIPRADTERLPEWPGRVHLIDLHRLRRHRHALWWQVKDLAQLLYSSEVAGITARDRLRFWRLYRGPKRDRGKRWTLLAWCIRLRWWNYRRHNRTSRRRLVSPR
jgi:heptose I phosphotransferase